MARIACAFQVFRRAGPREQGWYYRARNLLKSDILSHRLSLISEVIALIVTEIQGSAAKLR
jgi:hypothetical protein